ncbi:DUF3800 domain-containing protein [Thiococcus pfennigii]|uniref:DUF3800 domain-containing protein n=1 Tax=Thiococcus pfennigii TaxID=1057 RepID=UPI001908026A|nr:DUF3800 domain-containing protein [Thiococcus pfennigii]MBK1732712.1 hypothetical protein [Thiococcus pfennigii]
MSEYSVYCDESGHLERDEISVMTLGALWCPSDQRKSIRRHIRELKVRHGLPPGFEVKWTKVSPGQLDFYRSLVHLFFGDQRLHFRAVVVPDKSLLRHGDFPNQDHDLFYYKMFFLVLREILRQGDTFRIYLDIKDTRGQQKVEKLSEVLCNANYDFDRRMIRVIQQVRSHEIEQQQLADLLIGAVGYANRGLDDSTAKLTLVREIMALSGHTLTRSTLPSERKFNVLRWEARGP